MGWVIEIRAQVGFGIKLQNGNVRKAAGIQTIVKALEILPFPNTRAPELRDPGDRARKRFRKGLALSL